MKKIVLLGVFLIGIFTIYWYLNHPLAPKVTIRNHTWLLELAISPEEKERGLGYRDRLAPERGMLFIYDHKEQFSFWMKGMRFPLDFIWIDGATIVDITKNVPVDPHSINPKILAPTRTYRPAVAVDKILELNAGAVDTFGIAIGDTVEFSDK
ncbi:MAG: DUF192 domain-containing protein [bacterium]|nr:DUF192 domain-containing protein [bacterium]